jgi:carboxyl-terminal processing protease
MSLRRGLVLAGILVAPLAAQTPQGRATRPRTLAEDLQLFSQVLNQIRVNHPDSMDSHAMMMASIEALVRAVDPHSFVIPAVRLDSARQRAFEDGKLAPVPITFVFTGGAPTVVSVAPATHASRQDIVAGDQLEAIDGQPVSAASSDELEVSLAGQRGTATVLRLRRRRIDGSTVRIERTVRREVPDDVSAVPLSFMIDSITGYARITTFANDKVAGDLHDALGRLERAGMRRFILDLRDNGGGLVTQAGDVAGEFLPRGAVVYTTEGRKEAIQKTVKVSRSFWQRGRPYPMVVLVNQGTASASELVAGALQDHDRALIVGRPSFGKALLMQGVPLSDGSVMMLVVGHVKTPCGRVVQRRYRGIRYDDYYRDADADRDTTGRPSCRTPAGRTVYGGGGIYPDLMLAHPAPTPVWLAQLREQEAATRWAGMRLPTAPAAVDAYLTGSAIDSVALASFREFARTNAVEVPSDPASTQLLRQELTTALARARLGDSAFYRARLANDPWIQPALQAFDRASLLKGPADP